MKRCVKPFARIRFTLPHLAGKLALCMALLGLSAAPALAQEKYDTGVADAEIKIGNIIPYSGPASAYGTIGKTMSAYFRMINDNGGINGRKINFISYDDGRRPTCYSEIHEPEKGAPTLRRDRSHDFGDPAFIRRDRSTKENQNSPVVHPFS